MAERIKFSERRWVSVTAIALVGGLALSGCNSDASGQPSGTPKNEVEIDGRTIVSEIERTFTDDGQMLTIYGSSTGADYDTLVKSSCNGTDLVDVIAIEGHSDKGMGGSIERSPNHPACTDGRLDPSDFEIPTSTPTN